MADTNTSEARFRRWTVRLIGIALTAASILYIGREILRVDWPGELDISAIPLVISIALSIGLYVGATTWLAFIWWRLICAFHKKRFSFAAAFRIYATTQIYKYLPSNVIHLLGRHVAGNRQGVPADVLALTVLCEMFMLSVAAACMSVPMLLSIDDLSLARYDLSQKERVSAIALFVFLFVATSAIVGFVYIRRKRFFNRNRNSIIKTLVAVQIGYFAFFGIFGLIGIALVFAVASESLLELMLAVGIMSLAWLLGFVVPGAPAGLGIREATILVFLTGTLGAAHAILVALSFRIVTLLGDIAVALVGAAVPYKSRDG